MKKWLVTGVSGSGRIELLNELKAEAEKRNTPVLVHDIGGLIREQAEQVNMRVVDERILDVDPVQLRLLRTCAIKSVQMEILKHHEVEHHFIGTHVTFRWKRRLIPGISYKDIFALAPDGMVNVVNDVAKVHEINSRNPKWKPETLPRVEETQDWMVEEEFVTEMLAEVTNVPVFLIARRHTTSNLADLFFSGKKRIYLSYPITAVRDENPEILAHIQGPILKELETLFVVFNPLDIEDMALSNQNSVAPATEFPTEISQLTPRAIEQLKDRTVERDFQFIDQSDAVVVFYLTEKLSPGVIAEILYAHRNQKPVFIVFSGKRSPFLEYPATEIKATPEELMSSLRAFAAS